LSIPTVVGINGVEGAILPPLSDAENDALRHSAKTLQKAIEGIGL
jgi:malate/lactate dehydrogenase